MGGLHKRTCMDEEHSALLSPWPATSSGAPWCRPSKTQLWTLAELLQAHSWIHLVILICPACLYFVGSCSGQGEGHEGAVIQALMWGGTLDLDPLLPPLSPIISEATGCTGFQAQTITRILCSFSTAWRQPSLFFFKCDIFVFDIYNFCCTEFFI